MVKLPLHCYTPVLRMSHRMIVADTYFVDWHRSSTNFQPIQLADLVQNNQIVAVVHIRLAVHNRCLYCSYSTLALDLLPQRHIRTTNFDIANSNFGNLD